MLAITIARAKEYDHMVYHFCNMWMTQIFLWTMILNKAKNMKLLLCVFEQLSGLKIKFHKKRNLLLWPG